MINYTTSSKLGEVLILNTAVTLGYDIPWRNVHKVLLEAASATENMNQSSKAFILQTSLDDFFISYELNYYSNRPDLMAKIYSDLHQNIQDKCKEAGIEILSPHYRAIHNGDGSTILD
ncbi:MAG: mechanosensitive ion channel [Leptospira sp.]|nr:mechanosensitive ion channel [Leptospira sp.]NCS93561.1 mechanosensitive ion channel [Leptospira sp.]